MNWPRRCIKLKPGEIQQACELISGFGISWVTGWKDGESCIWSDDDVTVTKFVLMFGKTSEIIDRD